jgi:RNA recognition motif-containing protein
MAKRLYLGNLPYSASADDVRAWFAERGFPVDDVLLVTDRDTGRRRGYGFAALCDSVVETVDEIVAGLNGQEMLGRALVVAEARRERVAGGGDRRHASGRRAGSRRRAVTP